MANNRNYQVVIGPTNREKLFETGICVGYLHGHTLITGKYKHVHAVIKELDLICYSEVALVPSTQFPERT
ncbi:hypothetical protein PHABIO_13 [Pseudomonas phage Phabio]|uniref:Uncharacterized protein n=1 Tax=Pseudomonas phage Phabio TaxID=2006668 RepID=A0A1Y0SVQ1_9CAUD|nr:hypothetical protein MZD05_gp013 [Pseudomonas phage Phabio]ARV76644.1 hypothetical protein PHABIO_13 [Pseudomonas phage Phabio]